MGRLVTIYRQEDVIPKALARRKSLSNCSFILSEGLLLSYNPDAWLFLRKVLLEHEFGREDSGKCFYCGKEVQTKEAVVRNDIVMCQKCAEEHPLTADAKKDAQ